jgi:hypothetical protein
LLSGLRACVKHAMGSAWRIRWSLRQAHRWRSGSMTVPSWARMRDCREFRVWLVMMGKKELPHGPTQSAADRG